ncbi:hypothetical protein ACFUC1_01535 [Pedococcus sp. NPDC057267]|uniref:hypothetical protein n=1 Tax=Pedococcus sp. NPDC057267 TaxID=3346077 RepID=UPI003628B158
MLATLLGSGCASRGDSIDPATQTLLQRDVQTLTRAAAAHDYAAARDATATLTADLNTARTAGKISDTKQAQVHAAILKVAATLAAQPTPTPSPPPTTPAGNGKIGDGKARDGEGNGD